MENEREGSWPSRALSESILFVRCLGFGVSVFFSMDKLLTKTIVASLGISAYTLIVLYGFAVFLATLIVYRRTRGFSIENMSLLFFVPAALGAAVQLGYTFFSSREIPRGEMLADATVPGALYALCGTTIWIILWHAQENRQILRAGLIGADRFYGKARLGYSLVEYIIFHVAFIAAGAVGLYYAVTWTPVPLPTGRPTDLNAAVLTFIWNIGAVRLVAGIMLAVLSALAVHGLWVLLIVLLDRKRPLEDEKALGAAGRAAREATQAAARGNIPKPPWAKHGYQD